MLSKMAAEEEKYFERKRAAVQYLKDHEVPKCFQKLLNDVVLERPKDIFGYMAEYFASQAKPPTIANVTSSEALSPRGYSSFHVEIDALLHGKITTLNTCHAPFDNKPITETKPSPVKGKSPVADSKLSIADREQSPETKEDQIQSMIQTINTSVKPSLVGTELYDQKEIDRILEDIILTRSKTSSSTCVPKEDSVETVETIKDDKVLPNDETKLLEDKEDDLTLNFDVLTVSMAVTQSASYLQKCQLYCYLYKTIHNQEPSSLSLPTPMLSVLRSDKRTTGKLYMLKDLMIFMKKDLPPVQALRQLIEIYRQLDFTVRQKPTSSMTADNGALTPVIDKPEQALDLIRDAISSAGFSYEDDVAVAVNVATKDIFDKDKQKYEICLNAFKSCDELVNVYVDLCERYPEIKVLIDPFLPHDREGFSKLQEKIRGNCFIINQESFSNNPKFLRDILKEGLVSGNIMKMESVSTVTKFLQQVKPIEDCFRVLLVSPNEVETDEHFMVDMAVAVQADFIVFGAPGCSENIRKYNRLQKIEHNLSMLNILKQKQPLVPKQSSAQFEDEEVTTLCIDV